MSLPISTGGEQDFWGQTLEKSSLDGVEFYVANREVEGGRDYKRYRYQYRDGQGVEDTGRTPYVFNLSIPLFRGVSEALYPGALDDLIAVFEDASKKGEVEYFDPEFGPIDVKVDTWRWVTNPTERNGGHLQVRLEERSFEQSITSNLLLMGWRSAAKVAAGSLDYEMDVLGVDFTLVSETDSLTLTDLWDKVQDTLDDIALAADDIAAEIDRVNFVAQRVLNFSLKDEIERWSITNAIVDFAGAAQNVGRENRGTDDASFETTLVQKVLPDDMSSLDIAMWLYGDSVRSSEIELNNPVKNPMLYTRGTVIKVLPP